MAPGRLQRRGPCSCGSFRPLADCCLPWEEAFQRLVARLAAFAATERARRLRARAVEVFWGGEMSHGVPHGRSAGGDACFTEWFLLDYVPPKRTGPLLGEFADAAGDLNPFEERVLFAMLLTPTRAFEVTDTPGTGGAPVKDLFTGSEGVLGPHGIPEGLIRSDVCIGRLLPVGRLGRTGMSLIRLPQSCQNELLAYLRAAYGLSRPGRRVSLEDYVDGAAHLYHHFFLNRGRELGGRAHRTCRWTPFVVGRAEYRGLDVERIRAALARQSDLERVGEAEGGVRYVWTNRPPGMARGTVLSASDRIQAEAETEEDLATLCGLIETCLRGLVTRVALEASAPAAAAPDAVPRHASEPAGRAFVRSFLERWPDTPSAVFADRAPRQACQSEGGREEVAQALLSLEREMARQKRLGRPWVEIGPLWERLNLLPPSPTQGRGGEGDGLPARPRESRPVAKP